MQYHRVTVFWGGGGGVVGAWHTRRNPEKPEKKAVAASGPGPWMLLHCLFAHERKKMQSFHSAESVAMSGTANATPQECDATHLTFVTNK